MHKLRLNGSDWTFKEFLGEDWVWRDAHKKETKDIRWWKPGCVPGSVIHDLYRVGEIPDPYYEKNSLLIEWVPQRTWIYRKIFSIPAEAKDKRVKLCFDGVDYEAIIYLNDICLGEHSGMFTSFSFDISEFINLEGENLLAVVIQKAPDEQPQVSKTKYVKTHKSRMTYWWDFCPRMIHQGIWDHVYLEFFEDVHMGNLNVSSLLNGSLQSAIIEVQTILSRYSDQVKKVRIDCKIEKDGHLISQISRQEILTEEKTDFCLQHTIEQPDLWWPNGYGDQPLYNVRMEVFVCHAENKVSLAHKRTVQTGIRQVTFMINEDASADARPYTLSVNGRVIFMKGWNWVPVDVMYGVSRPEKLKHLMKLARDAQVNILRVWGGGLIEREAFYRLCDQYGIMVWQEFIQSSSGIDNQPSDSAVFLELMGKEAGQIIPVKKRHPSLVLWGGGNELQSENGTMIKDSEPVIAILREKVQELDPGRYFLPSSPTGRVFNNQMDHIMNDPEGLHDVHGPWEHQGLKAHYELYNSGTSLLSSEFGVEGMTNIKTLRRYMAEKHLWPPSRDNSYYFHRGSWWNNYPLLQECYGGQIKNIDQAVMASQLLQYEGLKYAVESNMRRSMHCSGTFPWQFNEPYPNNTCTSAVDYEGMPKSGYEAVKKAYAAVSVTAKYKGQSLVGEAWFQADIYLRMSQSCQKQFITAKIADMKGHIISSCQFETDSRQERAVKAGELLCETAQIKTEIFLLLLEAKNSEGQLVAENRYLLTKSNLAPLLSLDKTEVKIRSADHKHNRKNGCHTLLVSNMGETAAIGVRIELRQEKDRLSENYFYLLPGEEKVVTIETDDKTEAEYTCLGFNV